MRRLLAAIAAAAILATSFALAGCGGTDPRLEEPRIRNLMRDLNRALYSNDKEKVKTFVLSTAGQGNNPVGAKDADTPEGRDHIQDGNRRNLRQILVDAGIMKPADLKGNPVPDERALDRFDSALRIVVQDTNATGKIDIEPVGTGKRAEVVTFKFVKSESGWHVYDFEREMKAK